MTASKWSEFELNKASDLADQILALIKQDADLTHDEAFLGCLAVIGELLTWISCSDCRELAAKYIKSELPRILRQALKYTDKEMPGGCTH